MCVCLITMLALFLCLKQPFTGINIQAKSQLGSLEEQLSTIMYPPSSVLNHQEKNSSLLSVLGFGMKAGIFLTHRTTSKPYCQVHRGQSRYRTLTDHPQLFKKKKKIRGLMTKRAIQALTSHYCKSILETLDNTEFQSLTALSRTVEIFHS